jgi:hypothetical protein
VGSYIATWGVFVLDVDGPVEAARVARQMADEHFRSMWGVEEVVSGDRVSVDVELGVIVNPLIDDDEEDQEVA